MPGHRQAVSTGVVVSASLAQLFCCLNPDERSAMRGTAIGLTETLNLGIPVALWDVLWLPLIPSRDERKAAFINLYLLEVVEVEFGLPPVLTDVVRATDFIFWLLVDVLVLSPSGACLDGCSLCVPYPCA